MASAFVLYNVFGWKIHRKQLAAGDTYKAVLPEVVVRERIDNVSFWVKGRIEGRHTNPEYTAPIRPRVAGFFTPTDVPELVAPGAIEFECVEDSEWWCVNYRLNRKKLPKLAPLVLKTGESAALELGQRLFICRGSGVVGDKPIPAFSSLVVSAANKTLTATSDMYGLYFL